jgi:sugar phosphate isomerase/epimerase
MRVGMVHFMLYPECMGGEGPVVETARELMEDPFFDAIEITHVKDEEAQRKLRAAAEAARVELAFGAQPILLGGGLNLNHPEEAERKQAVRAVCQGIDQAAALGCTSVAVLSGKVAADAAEGRRLLVDSLKQICTYAAEEDLRVALETFDQADFGKNCLIGPTSEAVKVSEEVRQAFPEFGLLIDLSHLPLLNETAEESLRAAADHLVHAHIGNCAMDDPEHEAYGDMHPPFGAPGTRNDTPEVAEYLHVLKDIGYLSPTRRGLVSFEVKPLKGQDPRAVVAGCKRTLLDAWSILE